VNKKRLKKFNISNKLAYTLIALSCIILFGIGVYAYCGTTNSSNFGHTIGEVAPPENCLAGQTLIWTGTAWNCETPVTGLTGYEVIYASGASIESGVSIWLDAVCPSGKKVISGGCYGSGIKDIGASYPKDVYPVDTTWTCRFDLVTNFNSKNFYTYAICANI